MALGDYILCNRCNCKLIYDGDMGNREWWVERFGKEPEILCPPCQQEMAMARVQLLGQAMDDVRTRPNRKHLNRLCQIMSAHGMSTGHGDDMGQVLDELEWQLKEKKWN